MNVWELPNCPVTGLPIRQRREWIDIPLVPGYSATFCQIGDRILLSAPRGNAGTRGMLVFLETRERVLRDMALWEAPHVEIKDFDAIDAKHDPIARTQFTAGMLAEAARGYLRGFWGYGGALLFRWILRVAKQRTVGNRGPFPTDFVRDYRAAILAADGELERNDLSRPSRASSDRGQWILERPDHRVYFRLVGDDIVLAQLQGHASLVAIDDHFALLDRALAESGWPEDRPFWQVLDVRHLHQPAGLRIQRRYLQHLRGLISRRAFGGTVVYGVSGAAARVAARLQAWLPGPMRLTRDFEQALAEVERLRQRPPPTPRWLARSSYSRAEIDHYVDELLSYASSINWDRTRDEASTNVLDEANPFKTVHAAITLLKHDFNTLLQQKEAAQAQVLRAAKLASLGTFAAGLAHELNNPLTTVTGFAQRLARAEDEATREQATAILRAASRMRAVIGQLDAERAAGAAIDRVIVARCLEDVIGLLEPELQRLGIEFEQQVPAAIRVRANPAQLESVFVNVLINACQALEGIKDRKRKITIQAEEVAEWIDISVDDSGDGMSEEVRARACDPFFTTKDVGQGSGLGLYLIHRIIEAHGGSLRLDVSPLGGCRVVIRLRRTRHAAELAGLAR